MCKLYLESVTCHILSIVDKVHGDISNTNNFINFITISVTIETQLSLAHWIFPLICM